MQERLTSRLSHSQVLLGNAFPDAPRPALSFTKKVASYFTVLTQSVAVVRYEVELRNALKSTSDARQVKP